eukprot:PhF_6_TR18891/c0_g1_i1/m.27519/K10738/MCM9; DNA helicase MCM9
MSSQQRYENFCKFITHYCIKEMFAMLQEEGTLGSLPLDLMHLLHVDPELGHDVCLSPQITLQDASAAALCVQQRYIAKWPETKFHLKEKIFIQLTHLPFAPRSLNTLRTRDVGTLMNVTGTVLRVTDKKVVENEKQFQCIKCGTDIIIKAEATQKYRIRPPSRCSKPKCKSYNFKELPLSCWMDVQELRVRDRGTENGAIPAVLTVILERQLTNRVQPGEDIAIVCYPILQWESPFSDAPCYQEIVLYGLSLSLLPKHAGGVPHSNFANQIMLCSYATRDKFVDSICSELKGMFVVKLATALMLVGGLRSEFDDGVNVRGESHMLVFGDPGTGKTLLLQRCLEICGRGVFTTGVGSSLAGLTATAVKENGEWHLEAGALVLSDSGVCCLDDFNKLNEGERMSLLEAMEQQSVSIAKAGIVIRLPTRCNVMAAYTAKSPSEAISFSLPLLSRFDMIFQLRDVPHRDWDAYLAQSINKPTKPAHLEPIQKYIEYAKTTCTPSPIPEDLQHLLTAYYDRMKEKFSSTSHPITTRALEALIRLTQSHTRLMCRAQVNLDDAITAIYVMEHSLYNTGIIESPSALHTSPPPNPDMYYEEVRSKILQTLCTAPIELPRPPPQPQPPRASLSRMTNEPKVNTPQRQFDETPSRQNSPGKVTSASNNYSNPNPNIPARKDDPQTVAKVSRPMQNFIAALDQVKYNARTLPGSEPTPEDILKRLRS